MKELINFHILLSTLDKAFYNGSMKIKELMSRLEKIIKLHGDDMEVIMADGMPVARAFFSNKYPSEKSLIITDE